MAKGLNFLAKKFVFIWEESFLTVVNIVKIKLSNFKEVAKQLRSSAHALYKLLAMILFEPRSCLLCQVELAESESQKDLCVHCKSFFESLGAIKTVLIGDDDLPAITCFSSGFYSGPLQEAVYQIKYLKKPELAGSVVFSMIPPAVALSVDITERANKILTERTVIADLIVPVPLHKSKLKERGFNQAQELAEGLARLLNMRVDTANLKRIRATRPQFGLSRGERRRNLEGAFVATKKLYGKRIIIIDDVLTSGATIYECARAITDQGGIVVGALTLARAKWQRQNQPEESTIVPGLALVL